MLYLHDYENDFSTKHMRYFKNHCLHFNYSLLMFSKKVNLLIIFAVLIVFIQPIWSQNNNTSDSLSTKTFSYLNDKIILHSSDPYKGSIYANAYLLKAKKEKDSSNIVQGFYLLSYINKENLKDALTYLESAITFNKNNSLPNFNPYLHRDKGNIHYIKGEYKKALKSYLNAKNELDFNVGWNQPLIISIDYNIGLLMLEFREFNDAINIFNEAREFILEMNLKEQYIYDYLEILHGLSISYWYNNTLDSTVYYNDLQYQEAILHKNLYHEKKSRITQALIYYKTENYQKALDSISKYESFIEETQDSIYLAVTQFYKGKIYQKLGNPELAIKTFKKVDTIIQKNNNHSWVFEENYKILRNYYQDKGDLKNQLFYLDKLINFDSILYSNNTYLKNTILTKYNTPKLIAEKEILISALLKKDNRKSKVVYFISTLAIIFLALMLYYYRKRVTDKKRFEALLAKNIYTLEATPSNPDTVKQLTIPLEIVNDVLKKISHFEEKKEFLDNTITLNKLSKNLGTNSNYLSRIINFHKNKNFSTYLSHLRIDYTIDILKEQPKLREYTIKAISYEVGFNSVETFTSAFYKRTKIYPSYFIKQLKKK